MAVFNFSLLNDHVNFPQHPVGREHGIGGNMLTTLYCLNCVRILSKVDNSQSILQSAPDIAKTLLYRPKLLLIRSLS